MELQINGRSVGVQADADTPLLWVIRDELGMTGTKFGCGLAQCGACTVLVDGVATRSCVAPVEGMAGRKITTIEAIEEDDIGKRVVEAWVKHQVPQCGYCQSGQVLAATALLKQTSKPTEAQIAAAMINLCRCGTYNAITAAVHDVAGVKIAQLPADAHPGPSGEPEVIATATIALAGIGALGAMKMRTPSAADAKGE